MDARAAAKESRKEEERKQGKIPTPPIPDLRFEQGVMLSIRPFIHRVGPKREDPSKRQRTETRQEAEKYDAMVGAALTAEGAEDGDEGDLFKGPVRIEWAQLGYVLFRDQVSFLFYSGSQRVGVRLLTVPRPAATASPHLRRCSILSCKARLGVPGP